MDHTINLHITTLEDDHQLLYTRFMQYFTQTNSRKNTFCNVWLPTT